MSSDALAIDFGTSNSAVAAIHNGVPVKIAIEGDASTLPTAIFFALYGEPMRIGEAATSALIDGDEGRYMRALKSVLGTSLFNESRLLGGKRRTLADVTTQFLGEVKSRAEAATGCVFTRVLSGRPVHFHSGDPVRDARAQDDLRACFEAAGFDEIAFMFEPEAAALATHGFGKLGETGLIVDIGGGTSDFSVFETEQDRPKILASHGIRLGGTDFDHVISVDHAMPRLGLGGYLNRTFADGVLPVPKAMFWDLATWAKIPFLYAPDSKRAVAEMVSQAVDATQLKRLASVLEHELGHQLALSVEAGKIAANSGQVSRIDMGFIEPGLGAELDGDALDRSLTRHSGMIRDAMVETLEISGVKPEQINSVVLVGGSSLMNIVAREAEAVCPNAKLERSEAFTAVVVGLALALDRSF